MYMSYACGTRKLQLLNGELIIGKIKSYVLPPSENIIRVMKCTCHTPVVLDN